MRTLWYLEQYLVRNNMVDGCSYVQRGYLEEFCHRLRFFGRRSRLRGS